MRLHRLDYSCYARFVQSTLDLAKVPFELVDVRYGDRDALATLTGGYIQVPVLELDDGDRRGLRRERRPRVALGGLGLGRQVVGPIVVAVVAEERGEQRAGLEPGLPVAVGEVAQGGGGGRHGHHRARWRRPTATDGARTEARASPVAPPPAPPRPTAARGAAALPDAIVFPK